MSAPWLRDPSGVNPGSIRIPPPAYDPETGQVVTATYWDGVVQEAIEVRRGLEDAAVLVAVVAELERRGYYVLPPDIARGLGLTSSDATETPPVVP